MYEALLKEAHEERIEVVYKPLKGRLKGLYCDAIDKLDSALMPGTAEK
jgi:hypothetical protein